MDKDYTPACQTFTSSPMQEQLRPSESEVHYALTLIEMAERGPAPKMRD
jgi:hypothetical protein